MNPDNSVPRLRLRSDAVLLGVAIAIAWAYLVWMAWGMDHMDAGMVLMPSMTDWRPLDLLLVWVMWALMMAAMMLPSATPTLLGFAAVARRVSPPRPTSHSLAFAAGYLLVWTAFSAAATLVQWFLLEQRLVSPMMEASSRWLGGALLFCAGAFQFTPWKVSCLRLCRAPMIFLVKHWRDGTGGALGMGLRHGAYCLGCCWALMALLFVLGVMNLLWIIALTMLVLAERTFPRMQWMVRVVGGVLCGWGLFVLARAATGHV